MNETQYWKISYTLGEAGVYSSVGFGIMSVALAILYGANNSSQIEDWIKIAANLVSLPVFLIGIVVYAIGVVRWVQYLRIAKAKSQP